MPVASHLEPTLIVGAGPIGLACAISARRRGLDPLVIDAGALANSILHYPIGMVFFTTPERLEIGGHPLTCFGPKATREEALKYYRGVARAEELRTRPYTRLVSARRTPDAIHCDLENRHGVERLACHRLVLATGYFDHPNRLDVPGEDLPHVTHYFREAHESAGLDVVVIGGKNSAVEAALQLFRAGARVTLVHRRPELSRSVKYWLKPDVENRIAHGEIQARFDARVTRITERQVEVELPGGREEIATDRVYALIGFHPDYALFDRLGVRYDTDGRPVVNPDTLETNVPGVHLAGSVAVGRAISEVFIENGRYDGEKIFGDPESRAQAQAAYARLRRPVGE
jgi:thioredoxin reductase (NADPH)